MKRLILVFVVLLIGGLSINMSPPSQDPYKIRVVVIDAGHGGKDPGAVGKTAREKDVALSIALKLGNYIQTNFKDVKVIYTRKTDVFIELWERPDIANKANADLFISIHCNSVDNPKPFGTETWVMGLHKSKANLEVAKKENSAILLENNSAKNYDNFNPNSPESYILFSLYQSAFRDQSIDFATTIENEFTNRANRHSRGVNEAGFLVLWKATMPSVLIETGFLSNPEEEKFLSSAQGQDLIASSIFRAFKQYKLEMEGPAIQTVPITEKPKVEPKPTDTLQKQPIAAKPVNKDTAIVDSTIIFGIQFTSTAEKKPASSKSFQGLEDVWNYYHAGLYKYVSGRFANLEDAVEHLKIVRSKGFSDAFVVAFIGGNRISPSEAVKLLKENKLKN